MKNLMLAFAIIVIVFLVVPFLSRSRITTLLPPRPVVVSYDAVPKKDWFNLTYAIWTFVRNDGGNGDVVIKITYYESNRSWMKSTRRYFAANETAKITMEFPEATLLGKNRNYRVNVR